MCAGACVLQGSGTVQQADRKGGKSMSGRLTAKGCACACVALLHQNAIGCWRRDHRSWFRRHGRFPPHSSHAGRHCVSHETRFVCCVVCELVAVLSFLAAHSRSSCAGMLTTPCTWAMPCYFTKFVRVCGASCWLLGAPSRHGPCLGELLTPWHLVCACTHPTATGLCSVDNIQWNDG